jgi:cupin superfamily acireductone dioxygenase involved in methionine salvage
LIGRQLNTFYDIQTELTDEIISNFTYKSTILIAADCSEQPKFALFVEYYKTNHKNKLKEVKIYTGGNYLTYSLENQNKDNVRIVVNGKDEVNNINKESYTYPPYEQFFDFK